MKFERHANNLFPTGRVFASVVQLEQYIKMFCGPWACTTGIRGKSFKCFYQPKKTVKKFIDETTQQRRNTEAPLSYACPFSINFSFIGQAKNKTKRHWKPQVFHLVSQSCNVCSFFLTYHATTQVGTNTSFYCIFSIAGPYNYNHTFT